VVQVPLLPQLALGVWDAVRVLLVVAVAVLVQVLPLPVVAVGMVGLPFLGVWWWYLVWGVLAEVVVCIQEPWRER
jgi:hypothetical protein